MLSDIQSTLKKGKTPLQKAQEKPVKSLLDQEIVNLSDKIQVLRNANNNNGNNGGFNDRAGGNFPQGGFPGGAGGGDFAGGFPGGGNFPRGGLPGGDQAANTNLNSTANALNVQVEIIAELKSDDFIENKLPGFLSPEQVALVKKARADDKTNSTCLSGLLDRASNPLQNGGRGNNNRGNANFNFNNNTKKANGQAFCMTAEATADDRLEPIRKVLAAGNLPLAKDKELIAEVFLKSQIKDLDDALRISLTASFTGNRGGGGLPGNRNNNPQQIIESTTDDIYKKVEAMLEPAQAETLKRWHFDQILSRGGIESLIAIEARQDTPLSDVQITRLTAAWPEVRNQIQTAAKSAKKNMSDKELDNAAMAKILDMIEPPQLASYQAARKYSSQGSSK